MFQCESLLRVIKLDGMLMTKHWNICGPEMMAVLKFFIFSQAIFHQNDSFYKDLFRYQIEIKGEGGGLVVRWSIAMVN